VLQTVHSATECNTCYNTLPHTATCCIALQLAATHCPESGSEDENNSTGKFTLYKTNLQSIVQPSEIQRTLQRSATHCNSLQFTATHCAGSGSEDEQESAGTVTLFKANWQSFELFKKLDVGDVKRCIHRMKVALQHTLQHTLQHSLQHALQHTLQHTLQHSLQHSLPYTL